jgi:large subunit ribosomal protein L22e
VEDQVFGIANIEKFLKERIKVDGKRDNLGSAVTVSRDQTRIYVKSEIPFSKRYLKYLTKKYLKKLQLRDYLHVISTGKPSYEIKYFNIHNEEENAEE